MDRMPDVVGLVLCDRMEVDAQAGRTSLAGIFHARHLRTFPTPLQRFTVYVALLGGAGEGIMELLCTRLDTEQDVYRYSRWIALPGAGQVSNLEIKVQKCVFPAPDRYLLALRFDHVELTDRPLDILRIGHRP